MQSRVFEGVAGARRCSLSCGARAASGFAGAAACQQRSRPTERARLRPSGAGVGHLGAPLAAGVLLSSMSEQGKIGRGSRGGSEGMIHHMADGLAFCPGWVLLR